MRLRTLFVMSHVATAVVSGGATVWALRVEPLPGGSVVPLAVVTVVVVAGASLLAHYLRRCFQTILHAAAKGDRSACPALGIRELDDASHLLCEHVQRWSEAATAARQQARDAELLLAQLDRRTSGHGPSSSVGSQLRQVLGGITSSVDADLCQIISCTNEIGRCVQEIADGAEEQNDAISKTTRYVEQISTNIDAVTRNADIARQAVGTLRDAASNSVSVVQTLMQGMDRIRANVAAGERKLRALNDQAREIASIIDSIGAISSRTDLLALNASIESVRAGEHGRGFAVVAEEVHKLAAQAAQASRDAAALIQSTQLETHESIADLNNEKARVDDEFQRVKSAREALERIIHIANDSAGRVGEISHAAEYQLQLAQDVVLAVERIANVAKGTRSRAEKASWTTKTLSKMARQFDTALIPLRRCLDSYPKTMLGKEYSDVPLESGESAAVRPRPVVDLGAAAGSPALNVTHAG